MRLSLNSPQHPWLRRFGMAAFFFFLAKGLLWLIVPAALVWWKASSES